MARRGRAAGVRGELAVGLDHGRPGAAPMTTHRPFDRSHIAPLLDRVLPEASAESRAALARHAQLRAFSRHEQIVSQGYEPVVALVVSGHLGGWRSDPDGRQQMIRIVEPGGLINLVALRRGPAWVDLVGLDHGLVAVWPGDLVLSLARRDAGLGVDLLRHAIAGTERLVQRVDRMTFDSVTKRLARILWAQRELLFRERPLLSRPQLADLAGATREMTGRVIRDLERRDIVRRTGRTGLVLVDPDALRAEAGLEDAEEPWTDGATGMSRPSH